MTQDTQIEKQAAAWLALRDATEEREKMAEFAQWLAADPRHRSAYLRLAATWERTASLKRLRPQRGLIDADLLKPRKARRAWLQLRPLAVAASVVVIALGGLWWGALGKTTYSTEVGGLSRIVLKDGSAVTLNTNTQLRVHLSSARREIELLRGEAQFAVAHDSSRPFEVHAHGHIVRAVGTAFDVRLNDGQSFDVVVTDGRVAVVPAKGGASAISAETTTPAAMIPAGEAAVVTPQEVTVRRVTTTDVARRLAWQAGELSFQGETLQEAVAEFNRYNRRKLSVTDPELAKLQIGGNFRALDTDSFVAALARSFSISASMTDDGTVLLTRSPSIQENP